MEIQQFVTVKALANLHNFKIKLKSFMKFTLIPKCFFAIHCSVSLLISYFESFTETFMTWFCFHGIFSVATLMDISLYLNQINHFHLLQYSISLSKLKQTFFLKSTFSPPPKPQYLLWWVISHIYGTDSHINYAFLSAGPRKTVLKRWFKRNVIEVSTTSLSLTTESDRCSTPAIRICTSIRDSTFSIWH
jgi:hypothetical protein